MNPQEWKLEYSTSLYDLSNKKLGIDGLIAALSRKVNLRNVAMVDLSHNICLDDVLIAHKAESFLLKVKEVLIEFKNVKSLIMTSNHLFDNDPHPSNLHTRNYLNDLSMILANSSVTELDLSDNNVIGKTGRQLSAFAVLCRKYLSKYCNSFTCRLNNMTSRSLMFLSECMGSNSLLIYLDISDNCIGCDENGIINLEGVRLISLQMPQTKHLKRVNFARNGLCDDAICYIFNAISMMPHLQHIDISGNSFGSVGANAIKLAILNHSIYISPDLGLRYIDVSHNPLGQEGAVAVAESLELSETITSIDLTNCHIDKKAMRFLQKCLEANITIQEISIDLNNATLPVETYVIVSVLSVLLF